MPLLDFLNFTWLRNLLGIRKDLIDTDKSKLEVQKLKDEELSRKLITPATLDDVKKYDANYRKIRRKVEREEGHDHSMYESNLYLDDDQPSWWDRLFRGLWKLLLISTLLLTFLRFLLWILSFFNG
jgi:hypothetical protein